MKVDLVAIRVLHGARALVMYPGRHGRMNPARDRVHAVCVDFAWIQVVWGAWI